MFYRTVILLLTTPLIAAFVVHNETSVTDLGTNSLLNGTKDAVVSVANYTTDEMVETSCHIISEQLVASATATVSSAFSDLCRTDRMTSLLTTLEEKHRKEFESINYKIDRIIKHFMIIENDAVGNSTA